MIDFASYSSENQSTQPTYKVKHYLFHLFFHLIPHILLSSFIFYLDHILVVISDYFISRMSCVYDVFIIYLWHKCVLLNLTPNQPTWYIFVTVYEEAGYCIYIYKSTISDEWVRVGYTSFMSQVKSTYNMKF